MRSAAFRRPLSSLGFAHALGAASHLVRGASGIVLPVGHSVSGSFRAGAVVVVVSLLDVGLGGRRGAVGGCRYVRSRSLGPSV